LQCYVQAAPKKHQKCCSIDSPDHQVPLSLSAHQSKPASKHNSPLRSCLKCILSKSEAPLEWSNKRQSNHLARQSPEVPKQPSLLHITSEASAMFLWRWPQNVLLLICTPHILAYVPKRIQQALLTNGKQTHSPTNTPLSSQVPVKHDAGNHLHHTSLTSTAEHGLLCCRQQE